MKNKIVIITIVLAGFIFAIAGNSWAAREGRGQRYQDRGVHYQKSNKHADPHYRFRQGPHRHPGRQHFKPKHYPRNHRPARWKLHPRRWQRHAYRPVVRQINNYYNTVESETAPEEDYQVTASISDAEFSFSIGVSGRR